MKAQINLEKLNYAIQFMNGGTPWLVAAFVHKSDAEESCRVWNENREIYFVTEIES